MLRAVPLPPSPDRDVLQRLRITERLAVLLVEDQDWFYGALQVVDDQGQAKRFPITGEVSDGEVLSARLHDLKQTVVAMLQAGFALPPSTKAA